MARSIFCPDDQNHRQLESSRDIYGFSVLPQHLKRYREFADIYKVEEVERSERWENFLKTHGAGSEKDLLANCKLETQATEQQAVAAGKHALARNKVNDASGRFDTWDDVRLALLPIEAALNMRIKLTDIAYAPLSVPTYDDLSGAVATSSTEVGRARNGNQHYHPEGSEEGTEGDFYDAETSHLIEGGVRPDLMSNCHETFSNQGMESIEGLCPSQQELEALVRGGVPMALRGELWQVFVGTRLRRVQGHYNALLTLLADGGGDSDGVGGLCSGGMSSSNYTLSKSGILEKWTGQIEKDLPRTFPGHPALDEDGCNALRRLLTAYARHNPDVGYCQAMNFFAALLLLMMPEENAFWTLTAVIDDYFKGYYSENMIEAQVDQHVFEELIQEHFPKLVSHLDKLGVQVTLISGPWFLSIFVNILPWETVLRIWDVLLFEGNRSMLFRTALALMELHGPTIISTKDAGDALSTLQSMASASFNSSELVLVACMGYQMVEETRLQDLRMKHRPKVLESLNKRLLELRQWCNSHSKIASKPYNRRSDSISSGVQKSGSDSTRSSADKDGAVELLQLDSETSCELEGECKLLLHEGAIEPMDPKGTRKGVLKEEDDDASELLEQVKWLKIDLCQALEVNKAAMLRAQELETAFMELVKEDNRRLLSAKVETLKAEIAELKQKLTEKEEQEKAIVQVMLRMEQEQWLAENAYQFAEQDAAAQRHAANLLQVKYENALIKLSSMEKRATVAENMLEGLLQYQAFHAGQTTDLKESTKCFWSHIRFSPQDTGPTLTEGEAPPPLAHKQGNEELFKEQCRQCTGITSQLQFDVPPRKNGLFSHPFFVSWQDKQKGKQRFQDLELPTFALVNAHEPHSSNNSVSVSSQNGFDVSQPSAPSQIDSCYYVKPTVANDMGHLNDSITSMAAKCQQVMCNGSSC